MRQRWIFVMRERWVITGIPTEEQGLDPLFLRLEKVFTIRIWGTDNGVGQLAYSGPTEKTKLDSETDGTEINVADIMRRIPCVSREEKWKS